MSASAILKLQAAGFSAEQVTAMAELVDTQSATKNDVEAAEHRLAEKISATKAEIEAAEHRLTQKIEAGDNRLEIKITAQQGDMLLLKWMMGFVLAFQVAIFAKLFLH